jgi:peroxiredoxin
MRILSILLTTMLALTACNQAPKDRFTIEGTIAGGAGEVVKMIEFTLEDAVTVDSAILAEDGSFSITSSNTEPTVYMLSLSNAGLIPVLVENGDVVKINTTAEQYINDAKVEGSTATTELIEYFKQFNSFQERVAALNEELMPFAEAPDFEQKRAEAQEKYKTYEASQKKYVKGFIDGNKNGVVPVFASLYAANFISPESDFDWFFSLLNRFKEENPSSKYTAWFTKFVEPYTNLTALQPGKMAPDFKLPTPDGDTIALSDYRGKYVLVDFWASWCGPCRQENPNIVRMYNRFKGKNFEILGVSLDKERAGWVKAIADDQLTWKQVSDLKFWDSIVTGLYAIQSIPATLLVDPDGKIIARNLRGPELEEKIASLLE